MPLGKVLLAFDSYKKKSESSGDGQAERQRRDSVREGTSPHDQMTLAERLAQVDKKVDDSEDEKPLTMKEKVQVIQNDQETLL